MAGSSIPPTLQAGRSPACSLGFAAAVRIFKPFEDVIAGIRSAYSSLTNLCIFAPCSENGRKKITQNSIEVDTDTKESTRKTEEKLDGRYKDAMNERNLNEGQWEDRKQWSLGVGQRRKTFWNRYIYIYILTMIQQL